MPFKPLSNNIEFNSLPNDKILDQLKLKAFADDKIDFVENDDLYP